MSEDQLRLEMHEALVRATMPDLAAITDLIERLHKRATIRRNIPHRKSVQEGAPDRIADLLDEAGNALTQLVEELTKKDIDS
jgi:hypothetical protein